MNFYQDNKRDKLQPFSEDSFKFLLTLVISGCVEDTGEFIRKFPDSNYVIDMGQDAICTYPEEYHLDIRDEDERMAVLDYLIDIGLATHILYSLIPVTKDENLRDAIFVRLEDINDMIGPRTGETVITFN